MSKLDTGKHTLYHHNNQQKCRDTQEADTCGSTRYRLFRLNQLSNLNLKAKGRT